jgi:hypothetical protein
MKRTVVVALVCGTAMACSSDPGSFEGDGTLTDRGALSYHPRYQIRLQPAISLAAAGRCEFKFKGVPSVPLSLMLEIQGEGDYVLLRNLRTSVRVAVQDAEGKVICGAEGPLSKWTLMWPSVGKGGAYWQHSCLDLKLETTQWYTVLCEITDAESTLTLMLTPVLSGGGWDAP